MCLTLDSVNGFVVHDDLAAALAHLALFQAPQFGVLLTADCDSEEVQVEGWWRQLHALLEPEAWERLMEAVSHHAGQLEAGHCEVRGGRVQGCRRRWRAAGATPFDATACRA